MWEAIVTILNMIAGPLGGFIFLVVLFAVLLLGGYKLLDKHILPHVKDWFKAQEERFEKIMEEHEKDRKAFKESIELLAGKIQATDEKVDKLAEDIDELNEHVINHMKWEERERRSSNKDRS